MMGAAGKGDTAVVRLLCAWLCLAGALLAAQGVDQELLPNGMQLQVETRSANHVVAVRLDVAAGTIYEGGRLGSGLSRLLQRVLVAHADDPRITVGLDEVTASYRIATTDRAVPAALTALAQLLAGPSRWEDLVAAERGLQLREIEQQRDDPRSIEERWLRQLLYRTHPARLMPAGLADQLQSLPLDAVSNYHRQNYHTANMTLTVVGNITLAQVRPLIDQSFAIVRRGVATPRPTFDEPAQLASRVKQVTAPVPQRREVLAWRTVTTMHGDRLVFELIASMLANPVDSPLLAALSEQQLASDISVSHQSAVGRPGYFRISYLAMPDKAADARAEVARVLQMLTQQGPSQDLLGAAKRQVQREWVNNRNLVSDLADHYAFWQTVAHTPTIGAELQRAVTEISSERIQAVMARWLLANGRNRIVLSLLPYDIAPETNTTLEPAPTRDDVPPVQLTDLPAGVTALVRRQRSELVECRLVLGGGAAAAPADLPGLAHVHAAMLAQGSTNRSGRDLERIMIGRGMDFSVSAGLHHTVVRVTCFPSELPLALAMLIDPLRQPLLNDPALTRARQQTRLDVGQDRRAWRNLLAQSAAKVLLDGHYGLTQQYLQPEALDAIDVARVRQFHEQAVQGTNIHLAIYGAVDEAEVETLLRDQLAIEPTFVSGEAVTITAPGWPESSDQAPLSIPWDQPQAAVALVWRGPSRDNAVAQGVVLDVLTEILLGHGGLLTQALQQAGVVTVEQAMTRDELVGRGMLRLNALLPDPDQRVQWRETVLELLPQVAADLTSDTPQLVTKDLLQQASQRVWQRFMLAGEDYGRVAERHAVWLADQRLAQGLSYPRAIRTVAASELHQVLVTYLLSPPTLIEVVPVRSEASPAEPAVGTSDQDGTRQNPSPSAASPEPDKADAPSAPVIPVEQP